MEGSDIVAALSALGQATRWAVFTTLGKAGEAGMGAGDLATSLGTPFSTMSVHLAVLSAAGIVEVRRSGTSRNYRLVPARANEVIAAIKAATKS